MKNITNSIKSYLLPSCLKTAEITPTYKKGKKDFKENCKPVRILPVLYKLHKKILFKQMASFFENIFSKKQCVFRKDYNTQQCILTMLEKWKKFTNGGSTFGALLTDLSKAFDCLQHELIIAKIKFIWI